MHKTLSSNIFDLIHSMNKVEKKHFKLYACYHSKNARNMNYLCLFDAIERQKEYNEEKIVRKGVVKKERLSAVKHYLHHLILESLLVLRNKGNDTDNKLANTLEIARIMRDKGLEKEEVKFLEKTKQLALENERFGMALEVLTHERKAALRQPDFKALDRIKNEREILFIKLDNLKNYMMLQEEVFDSVKKTYTLGNIKNKELEKLMAHPLLCNESKALSIGAKVLYYNILFLYNFFIGNNKTAYEIITKHLRLAEEAGIELSELPYSKLLNNLTMVQRRLGKYQQMFSTIQKHRAVVWKSEQAKAHALLYSYINETNYSMKTGKFEKAGIAIKGIEKELERIEREYPLKLTVLYYNIATIYFGICNYHKALFWINKIINRQHFNFREDVQAWAYLFRILIHYELNTPDIIEHLIVSAYRFLLKREKLYEVEKSMLTFIRRLSKIDAKKKTLIEEFRRFRNELVEITKNPDEKKALEHFDLISWLESKIENRSFAEIIKEKAAIPSNPR